MNHKVAFCDVGPCFKGQKHGFSVIPGCRFQQSILAHVCELKMELDQIRVFQSLNTRRQKVKDQWNGLSIVDELKDYERN
jgi:hypothetical protein